MQLFIEYNSSRHQITKYTETIHTYAFLTGKNSMIKKLSKMKISSKTANFFYKYNKKSKKLTTIQKLSVFMGLVSSNWFLTFPILHQFS